MVPEPAPLVSLAVWERERLSLYGLPLSVSLYGRERLYGKGSQRSPRKGDPWERDKPSACSLSLSLSLSLSAAAREHWGLPLHSRENFGGLP